MGAEAPCTLIFCSLFRKHNVLHPLTHSLYWEYMMVRYCDNPQEGRDLRTEGRKEAKKQVPDPLELCLLQRWGRGSWQQAQNIHTQQHALQSHSWGDDAGSGGAKEGCLDHRASGLEATAPVEFGRMARGVSGRGQGAATPRNEHPSQSSEAQTHTGHLGGPGGHPGWPGTRQETRLRWRQNDLWIC